jgi:hypothetical protein
MHLLVGVALFPTSLPMVAKLAIWSALVLSLVIGLIQTSPRDLLLDPHGGLQIADRDGKFVDGSIDPATSVLGWLIVLNVRIERERRVLVLLPDSLGREELRRLRAWLKLRANAAMG